MMRLPEVATRRSGAARHWSEVGERGTVLGIQILFWTYRLLGRGAFKALLCPVVVYFMLAGGTVRRASRDYLAAVRRRLVELERPLPPRFGMFHHIAAFANALLDKLAMWAGVLPPDVIAAEDVDALERFPLRERGALFIGSHLGNLEVLRAFADKIPDMHVNALVFTRNSEKTNRVMTAMSPRTHSRLIQIDEIGPETVLMLRDKVAGGEHVAIMADRVSVQNRTRAVRAPFLGRSAPFPEGPFVLASLLECPVYLLFCVNDGERYRVHLEPFADPFVLPRATRQQALEQAVARYAERLEAHCLLAPTQWFNFFDFWNQAGDDRAA
jgi:predicted LPLAT superfamily acyltransferase